MSTIITLAIIISGLASICILACLAISNIKHCHPPRRKPRIFEKAAIAALLLGFAVSTSAAPELLFHEKEWQLDLNGFTQSADLKKFDYGGGFGVNYFPWQAAGFGAEFATEDTSSAFFDRIGVSLIGRLPIEKLRLAPEFKVGYDYDFERGGNHAIKDPNGHEVFASIGAELRVSKHVGFGVEVRGVKPLESAASEYLMGIARVRFNF